MSFEVWDTETFNRVGSFPTLVEAEAFLGDVLRVNGPSAVAEMTVVTYPEAGAGPVKVYDGGDYLARRKIPA